MPVLVPVVIGVQVTAPKAKSAKIEVGNCVEKYFSFFGVLKLTLSSLADEFVRLYSRALAGARSLMLLPAPHVAVDNVSEAVVRS